MLTWDDCVEVVNGSKIPTLNCLPVVFNSVITWALIFAGIVAVVFIIFAGIKFIRSGGQPKLIEDARNTLTYAIIGLIIIFLSFAIINFISAATGVTCIKYFGFGKC